MIKLLIGGSPCTFWSIARKQDREVEAKGIGWELFKNYLIAKGKFKPNFFLYENNKSVSSIIKNQIKKELNVYDESFFMEDTGARYVEINSALVSAQNRQRFYVHNCGDIEQPEDRGITLRNILESGERIPPYGNNDKARPINALYPNNAGLSIEKRIYSDNPNKQQIDYIADAITTQNKNKPIYEVKNGQITIKGKRYPIDLPNGYYIIRKLSVVECCRLQTLPDDYCRAVSNSQAYKGLGNGWTAEVIMHILNGALKNVPKDEEIIVLSMYDGIGTGRYCLDKMGFKNVKYFAYEIDKYAMQIAMSNYPDIIQMGDAFNIRNPDWTIGY